MRGLRRTGSSPAAAPRPAPREAALAGAAAGVLGALGPAPREAALAPAPPEALPGGVFVPTPSDPAPREAAPWVGGVAGDAAAASGDVPPGRHSRRAGWGLGAIGRRPRGEWVGELSRPRAVKLPERGDAASIPCDNRKPVHTHCANNGG